MRHILLYVLLVLSVSFGLSSCRDKTIRKDGSPKVASIQLDSTSAHIGTFPKSASTRTTVFTFTNVGDAPLEFLDHDVSCGCVSATFPEKPVKPGKKGEIHVTFKGKNKNPGKVYYKVYVETNGDPRILTLRINGQMTEN